MYRAYRTASGISFGRRIVISDGKRAKITTRVTRINRNRSNTHDDLLAWNRRRSVARTAVNQVGID